MYNFIVENFMSRNVVHIWRGITYQTLKDILKENKALATFPLVDSQSNMILLGSIRRTELIKMIDRQVGRKKRLQVAASWKHEEIRREEEERFRMMQEEQQFPVSTPDVETLREIANNEMLTPHAKRDAQFSLQPKKSILKKTGSFSSSLNSPNIAANTSYTTITGGAESRIRSAVDRIFRKSASAQEVRVRIDPDLGSKMSMADPSVNGNGYLSAKKVQLPKERVRFEILWHFSRLLSNFQK